jgi:hypothetical protein
MDDLDSMSMRKRACDLLGNRDNAVNVSRVDVQAGIEVAMLRNRHDQEAGLVASILDEMGIDDGDDIVMVEAPQNLDLLTETADAVLAPQPLQCPFARKFAGHVGDAIHVALATGTYGADDFPAVAVCLRHPRPSKGVRNLPATPPFFRSSLSMSMRMRSSA